MSKSPTPIEWLEIGALGLLAVICPVLVAPVCVILFLVAMAREIWRDRAAAVTARRPSALPVHPRATPPAAAAAKHPHLEEALIVTCFVGLPLWANLHGKSAGMTSGFDLHWFLVTAGAVGALVGLHWIGSLMSRLRKS